MTNKKRLLFVTGVARSGTTALAELLNTHPAICIGIERYKFRFLREQRFEQAYFERDRFFAFDPADTNLDPARRPAWQPVYDRIAGKWDGAEVVGDKVPDLLPLLPTLLSQMDCQCICILRNLKDVALSWQTRADKPRDAWPAGKGFALACESWASQHAALHELIRNRALRHRILLLDYDRIYNDVDMTEAALLAFLDLPRDPEFRGVLEKHAEFHRQRVPQKLQDSQAEAYKAVDQAQIRGLRKIAQEQREAWASQFGMESGS